MGMECRITVEVLENGYEVTVPDIAALNKAQAAYDKSPKTGMKPYSGDFQKSYAAKTVPEVLKIITPALKNLPEKSYDEAFAEAGAENED